MTEYPRAVTDPRDLTRQRGDPDAFQVLVTRGEQSPWVAEIVCDVAGEVIISLGSGQTVLWAIESAWVSYRAGQKVEADTVIESEPPLPFNGG